MKLRTPPPHAPIIHKNTLRWTVLLYVTTDPMYSWTKNQMVAEMEPMGHSKRAVIDAINGLKQRGLLDIVNWKNFPRLVPTEAGIKAMKHSHSPKGIK